MRWIKIKILNDTYKMETESKLTLFNNTLDDFVADLEIVINGDPFLQKLAGYLTLKSSNARVFITPFQKYGLCEKYVEAILNEDTHFFEKEANNYGEGEDTTSNFDFFNKIANIISSVKNNKDITHKIFEWLKLLVFFALGDTGIDATQFMTEIMQSSS